jgi:HD-GYP domain-containing protein (c-di-GMP phosphodiesterase class II)
LAEGLNCLRRPPPAALSLLLWQCDPLALALQSRDAYTHGHCNRVETLSWQLGQRCGLDTRELALLRAAARLHDIGKIGIPDHVLHKPGALSPPEWEMMKSHAEQGERICDAMAHRETPLMGAMVRHHHEAFDGGGYPDGLAGEAIPLGARILGVADAYDAIATARPYHPARGHDEVMAIMDRERGRKLDPYLLGLFERFIEGSDQRATH